MTSGSPVRDLDVVVLLGCRLGHDHREDALGQLRPYAVRVDVSGQVDAVLEAPPTTFLAA